VDDGSVPINNRQTGTQDGEAGKQQHKTTSHSTSSSSAAISSSNSQNSKYRKGKQKRMPDDDDEDHKDGNTPKRQKKLLSLPISLDDRSKFACPYRKNNPLKYRSNNKTWRSCALTPLEKIARVK
jgi:hypothetical protein